MNKTYLGDAVYAEWIEGFLKLTTEDGIKATNVIMLDDTVLTALLMWIELPTKET